MTDRTELGRDIKKLKDEMDILLNNSIITEILLRIQDGGQIDDLDDYNRKKMDEMTKIYQIGRKFYWNQEKSKKKDFLHDSFEGCLKELESIKLLYSERTYYRWKRRLKEKFPEEFN